MKPNEAVIATLRDEAHARRVVELLDVFQRGLISHRIWQVGDESSVVGTYHYDARNIDVARAFAEGVCVASGFERIR